MEGLALSIPLNFALIFFLGFLGYRLFDFLHIPGGAITGSLLMVAVVSSQGVEWAEIPSYANTLFQVMLGIVIGCKFSREKVSQLKSLVIPGLLSSVWMICISLAVGVLLAKATGLDLGTALFSSVPGGLSEMGLIALSYNLSVPVVTLFQFVRVITVFISVPVIVSKYGNGAREEAAGQTITAASENEDEKGKGLGAFATLVIGGFGGFTAKYFGIPVGGLLGAMIIVGILRTMGVSLKELPKWAVVFAQVGLGGYLGTTFTPEIVITLYSLLLPILIFSVVVVLNGVILGLLVHRFYGWDLSTSLLACAAAGVTQMSAIALDMDADAVTVSLIQALRISIILVLMPSLILFIVR